MLMIIIQTKIEINIILFVLESISGIGSACWSLVERCLKSWAIDDFRIDVWGSRFLGGNMIGGASNSSWLAEDNLDWLPLKPSCCCGFRDAVESLSEQSWPVFAFASIFEIII